MRKGNNAAPLTRDDAGRSSGPYAGDRTCPTRQCSASRATTSKSRAAQVSHTPAHPATEEHSHRSPRRPICPPPSVCRRQVLRASFRRCRRRRDDQSAATTLSEPGTRLRIVSNSPYAPTRSGETSSGRCDCCLRPWSVCIEPDQRWRPPKNQHTCKPCWEHAHAPWSKRDQEHINLWRGLMSTRVDALRAEISQLKAQLGAAKQELDERPEKEIVKYIGEDEIRAAEEESQRAFASRQRAWQVLSELHRRHRERNNGQCQCGRPFNKCGDAEIIAGYPAFMDWLKAEVARYWRGQPCDLPVAHPARFDPRWRP
jgi:hypothetical protein